MTVIIDLSLVANASPNERYRMPDNKKQWGEDFTTNVFDAKGKLTPAIVDEIYAEFKEKGALHLINTGLHAGNPHDISQDILEGIGFGDEDQFKWGGLTSGRTNLKYISKAMRETDDYPAEKFLLPHNEILYQRFMPERLMFYCSKPTRPGNGGRTFAHCALKTEEYISRCGPAGTALLDKMHAGGFTIVTGFLDENHPEKPKNYFRSWQDRFDTQSRDQALKTCKASGDQFDDCYWMEEPGARPGEGPYYTLMTSITVPAFKTDSRDGKRYMLFPRIALDGPMLHNGHRRFLIGQEELTQVETAILLQAFLATREGRHYQPGDMLLVDNIRYGHSRESFTGERKVYASMAGMFWTDDVLLNQAQARARL